MLPSEDPYQQLEWLNTPFSTEADQLIHRGLRKTCFEDLKSRKTRRPYLDLETLL